MHTQHNRGEDLATTRDHGASVGRPAAADAAEGLAARLGTDTVSDEAVEAWADGYLAGHDRGHADGYTDGVADYDRQLTVGLAQMLAGDRAVTDYADGLRRHERQAAARARRDTADHRPAADAATTADAAAEGADRPCLPSPYQAGLYRLSTDLADPDSLPGSKPADLLRAEQSAWESYVDAVERGDTAAAGAAAARLGAARDRLAAAPTVHTDADVDEW
jgi:hypothetical protein